MGCNSVGLYPNLKVPRYTITLFYLLKPNRIIVPGEIHES